MPFFCQWDKEESCGIMLAIGGIHRYNLYLRKNVRKCGEDEP